MQEPEAQQHCHERRKFVRADIYAVTRYFSIDQGEETNIQTRLSDISEGGARLLIFEEGIPIETEVLISFILPAGKDELITVKGKVRHSGIMEKNFYASQDLFRVGVEFTDLSQKGRRAIQKYVAGKRKKERLELG